MPIEYDYDQNLNILHCHPYGIISTKDIVTYFELIADDDRISDGFMEIVHFQRVDNFTFSSDQLPNVAIALMR